MKLIDINTKIKKLINFINKDIWRIKTKDLPRNKSISIYYLRVLILAIRGFKDDRLQFRASALTYFSLLSVVPIVAMAFGISKGFGLEERLQQELMSKFSGYKEIVDKVLVFAHSMLETTKGGVVAGVGLLLLFWVVMKMLSNIEQSFNDIWKIKKSRGFARKFTDYLSIVLFAPIFIILSSSATVLVTTQIKSITSEIAILGYVSPFIFTLLKMLPYALIWILLTLIYIIMPNTKVNFKSALLAGVLAGTIFQLTQWAYIHFQIGVSQNNAIYGSFAALPLFLIWLQTSWLIVLFGAEVAFASQNVNKYEYEEDSIKISNSHKRLLSLMITHLVISNFKKGEKALTDEEISLQLEIPIGLVRQITFELTECRVFSETILDDFKETAYQPAQDISRFTIGSVLQLLDERGSNVVSVIKSDELNKLSQILVQFNQSIKQSPQNILISEL